MKILVVNNSLKYPTEARLLKKNTLYILHLKGTLKQIDYVTVNLDTRV